ncbi:hypothetical protein Pst134EB_017019 [Puccinia striiformis f. sp. tritici]|nr:hypothetical protein Pst134EB_017019 [Puccinia striiformis f. sp. tritici]
MSQLLAGDNRRTTSDGDRHTSGHGITLESRGDEGKTKDSAPARKQARKKRSGFAKFSDWFRCSSNGDSGGHHHPHRHSHHPHSHHTHSHHDHSHHDSHSHGGGYSHGGGHSHGGGC